MKKQKLFSICLIIMSIMLFISLAGCGSGGGGGSSSEESTEESSTLNSVELQTPTERVVNTETNELTTTLEAEVLDQNNNPMSGVAVTFESDTGTFASLKSPLNLENFLFFAKTAYAATTTKTVKTNSNGIATAKIVTSLGVTPNVSARAEKDGTYVTADETISIPILSDIAIEVTGDSEIWADGSSTTGLKITTTDADGNTIPNVTVTLETTLGNLSTSQVTTNDSGVASVTLTSATTPGQAEVTAEAEENSNLVRIQFKEYKPGSISISSTQSTLVANGQSTVTITATVKDSEGNNIKDGTSVNFSTTLGTLSSTTATTVNGEASIILTSTSSTGTATITASAGDYNEDLSISFIAGSPSTISLTADKTELDADGQSTSTIKATVTDASGNSVADQNISFAITSGDGTLSATTAQTSAGIATITYTASENPGTVTIKATSENNVSSTTNITLIATEVGSITVSAGSSSIIANGSDYTLITVNVYDSNGNPIQDGTTVSFTTTAGTLSLDTVTTVNGVASIKLSSSTNIGTATVRATVGGYSATAIVNFIAGSLSKLNISPTPANLTADGESTSSIRITTTDAHDNPISGEVLTLSAQNGLFSDSQVATASTNDQGFASVTYTSPNSVPDSGLDVITVEATNGVSSSANISLIGSQISSITLSASPESLPADSSTQATISATLTLVGGGTAPDGTTVNFSIEQGGGSITQTGTTAGGTAVATLTSGSTPGTATIRAESGGRRAEITVEYTPGSVELTIVPNSLLGTGDQTAIVTATLTTASGEAAPAGETVSFTLDDQSLGTINSTVTTSSDGKAEALFEAGNIGDTVTVTATWDNSGTSVSGSETIEIQAPPAFIEMVEGSPDPDSIDIKGTGGQSTSLITFDVKDVSGEAVADGFRVDFEIESGPGGGEKLLPITTETSDGQISTILRSGTKSGPVSVKATYYYDTSVTTTTSQITINSGPPVGEEFGIFAQYLNISGLNIANLEDIITVSVGDKYGNAVPDGTAISFKTYNTGGNIDAQGTTTEGQTTAKLKSTTPVPQQGLVSITAEANNGGRTTRVTSIAVNQDDNSIIYVGTNGGGIYKSVDSGASWQNISRSDEAANWGQNYIDPYVNDLSIDPDNPNNIYAATGYLGEGNIYRSLDGGLNWILPEEWFGLKFVLEPGKIRYLLDSAVLTVLCDEGNNYVWIGTQGSGAFRAPSGEIFYPGGTASVPIPGATNIGDGSMSTVGLSLTTKTETWTSTFQQSGATASTPQLDTSGSNSGADGTMTDVSASSSATAETWTITYTGGYGAVDNSQANGHGTLTVSSTSASTKTENWTVTCTNATSGSEVFTVIGSISGLQDQFNDITKPYTSGGEEVTFFIEKNSNFSIGDKFTFSTTQDGWSVTGSISGAQGTARTDNVFTSDNGGLSFQINSGDSFYKMGDKWTITITISGNWLVRGTSSGTQNKRAKNGKYYQSDNDEVGFLITEGSTVYTVGDTFTFNTTASGLGTGKSVRDIKKSTNTGASAILYAASNTGIYKSRNGGTTWIEISNFAGDNINCLEIHPDSDGVTDIIYAGTVDNGIRVSTDSGATWNSQNTGLGKGLSASTPEAGTSNTGTGIIEELSVGNNATTETWTITCTSTSTDNGTFSVTGTVSGLQTTAATVGSLYTSDNASISFTIIDGSTDFVVGDYFTFTTTRDSGLNIKDLLVDSVNNKLYAVTYFSGSDEPHAVGNVYVHSLNADGSFTGDNWQEANQNLPEFDPPDDTTLFAQHAIAGDKIASPTKLYIGGEGINFYKASSGIDTGQPNWQKSQAGMTNLLMARMPILFTDTCTMTIYEEQEDSAVTFTIYVEDGNGNPPITGSTLEVIQKDDAGTTIATLLSIDYDDSITDSGTWRDPLDSDTNNPYIITTTVEEGNTITFTFTPKCESDSPGCSGSTQERIYPY